MNKEIKARWITALRSGEYQQGKRQLHTRTKNGSDQFCCLGVLCELAVADGVIPEPYVDTDGYRSYGEHMENGLLPNEVQTWAAIGRKGQFVVGERSSALSQINDLGSTFSEIADIIEEHF